MSNPFKDFFYFSRTEKRGILILTALILAPIVIGLFFPRRKPLPPSVEEQEKHAVDVATYKEFVSSVKEKKSVPSATLRPFPFDPNTTDSASFRRMGLPAWMARNIVRYRMKGGKFHQAEDFKKIYGLTEKKYPTLLPSIRISVRDTAKSAERPSLILHDSTASVRIVRHKYPEGTVIDLNLADTTELKKIPGICSGIARMITVYRERLGGFYRIEQLQDIRLDYRQLEPWFRIDSTKIRRINLNRSGIEKLRHHPYINFYQAKAFIEHRKKGGELHSLKPFVLHEEFSEADLERISHYVCFE